MSGSKRKIQKRELKGKSVFCSDRVGIIGENKKSRMKAKGRETDGREVKQEA